MFTRGQRRYLRKIKPLECRDLPFVNLCLGEKMSNRIGVRRGGGTLRGGVFWKEQIWVLCIALYEILPRGALLRQPRAQAFFASSASISARDGIEGAVPARVTEIPAVAQPNRTASTTSRVERKFVPN